ncbi:MAG: polyphenol oxidase family protein, partial [Spirochaetes bacterium]|nr:polyphenol oxidase family protein [Spirochaetota bacterium]
VEGLGLGVIGKSANDTDYGLPEATIRSHERNLLARAAAVDPGYVRSLNQVHGDRIIYVDGAPAGGYGVAGDADGLITDVPGVCLVIRSADCVPVFAWDPVRRLLGAVHSGWRGARLGIAGKLVREMERRGSRRGEIRACILPSIGPESYAVGREVADYFPGHTTERNGLILLDLWKSAAASLIREGIAPERIFNAGLCTLLGHEEFFSYRGGDGGRNLNYGLMLP